MPVCAATRPSAASCEQHCHWPFYRAVGARHLPGEDQKPALPRRTGVVTTEVRLASPPRVESEARLEISSERIDDDGHYCTSS